MSMKRATTGRRNGSKLQDQVVSLHDCCERRGVHEKKAFSEREALAF
jgi:hypothetical protein